MSTLGCQQGLDRFDAATPKNVPEWVAKKARKVYADEEWRDDLAFKVSAEVAQKASLLMSRGSSGDRTLDGVTDVSRAATKDRLVNETFEKLQFLQGSVFFSVLSLWQLNIGQIESG